MVGRRVAPKGRILIDVSRQKCFNCHDHTYGSDGYASDVEKRSKQASSSRQSRPDAALSGLVPLARRVYEDSTLYHGTKREHVPSIRQNGFQMDRKSDGATEGGGHFMKRFSRDGITSSSEYHYLTSSRQIYARGTRFRPRTCSVQSIAPRAPMQRPFAKKCRGPVTMSQRSRPGSC